MRASVCHASHCQAQAQPYTTRVVVICNMPSGLQVKACNCFCICMDTSSVLHACSSLSCSVPFPLSDWQSSQWAAEPLSTWLHRMKGCRWPLAVVLRTVVYTLAVALQTASNATCCFDAPPGLVCTPRCIECGQGACLLQDLVHCVWCCASVHLGSLGQKA